MNIAIRQAKLHILPLFYDRQISVLNVSCAQRAGLELVLGAAVVLLRVVCAPEMGRLDVLVPPLSGPPPGGC